MELINIGYGNAVNPVRIIAVVGADSAPAKRMIAAVREKNAVVDASCGKKTRTVFIMDSGHVILSAKGLKSFTKGNSAEGDEDE